MRFGDGKIYNDFGSFEYIYSKILGFHSMMDLPPVLRDIAIVDSFFSWALSLSFLFLLYSSKAMSFFKHHALCDGI